MECKYGNLRSKTIFDFTRDESILKKVFPEGIYMDYEENPQEFIDNCKEWFELRAIVGDLIEYSKITDSNGLYEALKEEFEDDFRSKFDTRKGVLVN